MQHCSLELSTMACGHHTYFMFACQLPSWALTITVGWLAVWHGHMRCSKLVQWAWKQAEHDSPQQAVLQHDADI